MEKAMISKGVALFATLIGIYTWIGQGASLFDIIILIFAAFLIISTDSENRKELLPQDLGENQNKKDFFYKVTVPLKRFTLAWREHLLQKESI
jgi:hypothetical protein